jgi:hypothetical protein
MGNRAGRRKPTRKEKIRWTRDDGRGTTDEERRSRNKKNKQRRRREVSAEAMEIGRAYAKIIGWPVERVLPGANRYIE